MFIDRSLQMHRTVFSMKALSRSYGEDPKGFTSLPRSRGLALESVIGKDQLSKLCEAATRFNHQPSKIISRAS